MTRWQRRARTLWRISGLVEAGVWAAMIPVTLVTGLKHSVPFLVAISLWALVLGALARWAGEKAAEEARSG